MFCACHHEPSFFQVIQRSGQSGSGGSVGSDPISFVTDTKTQVGSRRLRSSKEDLGFCTPGGPRAGAASCDSGVPLTGAVLLSTHAGPCRSLCDRQEQPRQERGQTGLTSPKDGLGGLNAERSFPAPQTPLPAPGGEARAPALSCQPLLPSPDVKPAWGCRGVCVCRPGGPRLRLLLH